MVYDSSEEEEELTEGSHSVSVLHQCTEPTDPFLDNLKKNSILIYFENKYINNI